MPKTDTETLLDKLCRSAFLSLWTYANPYRNERISNSKIICKEICDALVIFGNHILIFSDKNCSFSDSGDINLDWNRWYRKAVYKSANQLIGAKNWIKKNPSRVFIDQTCQRRIPINIPDEDKCIFHLILIAHGSNERCKQYFGNTGIGSLMLMSNSGLDKNDLSLQKTTIPFTIVNPIMRNEHIHILDSITLDVVLKYLDTVKDFIDYLSIKENLLRNKSIVVSGEEDLLAFYLRSVDTQGKHYFDIPEGSDLFIIDEGFWEKFLISKQYKSYKSANKVSYFWDSLIERLIYFIKSGIELSPTPTDISEYEIVVRYMAKESRFFRRVLSNVLLDMIRTTPKDYKRAFLIKPSNHGDSYYVFLLLPHLQNMSEEKYQNARRNLLYMSCMVARYLNEDALEIVGIATETGNSTNRSEDAVYIDFHEWTEKKNEDAKNWYENLGILNTNTKISKINDFEFPYDM